MSISSVVRNVDIGVEIPLTDNEIDHNVGRQLRSRREELGLSQTAVANTLGVSFQQVQKYERGFNRVSASRLWDLADILKVDVGFFFEGLPSPAERNTQDLSTMSDVLQLATAAERLPVAIRSRLRSLIAAVRHQCKAEKP